MKVYLIIQNGGPYRAFSDFDVASDEMLRLQKAYPWFRWTICTMSVS